MITNKNLTKLLEDKITKNSDITFAQLAVLTKYHQKSLIRLSSKLKSGFHINETRPRMQKNERKYIIECLTKCKTKSITNMYKNYCDYCDKDKLYPIRSYSQIYKIVKDNNLWEKGVYSIVPKKTFIFQIFRIDLSSDNEYLNCIVVIDYDNKKLIKVIFTKKRVKTMHIKLLLRIIDKYKKPDNLYVYGSHVIRAPIYGENSFANICNSLSINLIHEKNSKLFSYFLKFKRQIKEITKSYINEGCVDIQALTIKVTRNIKL